jgi:hypothetical protein
MGIDCLRQWSLRSQGDKGAYDAVEGRVYEAYEVKHKRQGGGMVGGRGRRNGWAEGEGGFMKLMK